MENKQPHFHCQIKWKVFDEKLKTVKEGKCEVLDSVDFEKILGEELNKINKTEINLIGHRIVHGKDIFNKPIKITKEVIYKYINDMSPMQIFHYLQS